MRTRGSAAGEGDQVGDHKVQDGAARGGGGVGEARGVDLLLRLLRLLDPALDDARGDLAVRERVDEHLVRVRVRARARARARARVRGRGRVRFRVRGRGRLSLTPTLRVRRRGSAAAGRSPRDSRSPG